MINNINKIVNDIISCRECSRLVSFREEIATKKRKSYEKWEYWGKPVPGFGDINSKLLILGLAPAAHGGNRTGRVFTGEESIALGLSDGFGSVSSVADEVFNQPFLIDYHGEEDLLDKLTENFIIRLVVTLKDLFPMRMAEYSIF